MRLGVAGFGMMNVMLLSVAVWSGAADATRDLFHWVSAGDRAADHRVFGPAVLQARLGRAAGRAAQHGRADLAGDPAGRRHVALRDRACRGEHAYFDAALSLTFFLLAGRYLDHRTRAVARSAAEELAALEVPRAHRVLADGSEEVVSVRRDRRGRPGAGACRARGCRSTAWSRTARARSTGRC